MDETQFRIQMMIEQKKLFTNYWIAMATTGAAVERIMAKGNRQLTDKEKIADALETALRHIHDIGELTDKI